VAQPFDTSTKELIEAQPADWLEFVGLGRREVEVINADLATITAAADKVLRVRAPVPWVAHLELQADYDSELDERTLQYSVLLRRRHHLAVRSVIVLLRPEADGPRMTGELRFHDPDDDCYLEFRYRIVRVWQKQVEAVLAGGLGALPLAPLAAVAEEQLPGVIRRMEERITQEASAGQAGILWAATYLLLGLRLQEEAAARLLEGVNGMKESTTYQAILREGREEGLGAGRDVGRLEEARAILLRLGTRRFGPPAEPVRAALEAITDTERLEALTVRVLDVESWDELLAE
jgi:predicted transposase YdaD